MKMGITINIFTNIDCFIYLVIFSGHLGRHLEFWKMPNDAAMAACRSWLFMTFSIRINLRLFWRGFLDDIYCWYFFWKWLWVSCTAKLSLVLLNFITKTPPRVRNCWYSQVYIRVSSIQRVEIVSRNFCGLIWQTWMADILNFYNHSGILLCGRDGDAWELTFLQD